MRKFLIPLVLVSTPAFAQNSDLSVTRMDELGRNALSVCRNAHVMGAPGDMAKNVLALSGARTIEEKVFILRLCKVYLDSKIEDMKNRNSDSK